MAIINIMTIEPDRSEGQIIVRIDGNRLIAYFASRNIDQIGAESEDEDALIEALLERSDLMFRQYPFWRGPHGYGGVARVVLHRPLSFDAVVMTVRALTGITINKHHIVRKDRLIKGMREVARAYDRIDRTFFAARLAAEHTSDERHNAILKQVMALLEPLHDEREAAEQALREEFCVLNGFYPDEY